jgi:hypothetical protein
MVMHRIDAFLAQSLRQQHRPLGSTLEMSRVLYFKEIGPELDEEWTHFGEGGGN